MNTCPRCQQPSNSYVVYVGENRPSICSRCAAKEKKEQTDKLKVVRRERIPLRVGMTTLVGTIVTHEFSGPCEKCGHDHSGGNGHYRGSVSSGFVCCEKNCGGRIPIVDPFPLNSGNCCSIGRYHCRNMNSENVDAAVARWPELADGVEIEVLEDESCRVIDERLPPDWRKHFCSGCGYFENPEAWERFVKPRPPRDESPKKLNTKWSGASELETGIVYAPYTLKESPPNVDPKDFNVDPARAKTIKLNPDTDGKG